MSITEPRWILQSAVLAIHNRQLAEHGGSTGIRDSGLLDSALNKPKQLFYYGGETVSLAALAAAYAYGIARNHPFIDGNKRTAYVSCRLFLQLNGHDIYATQSEKYQTFLALAAGELTEGALIEWIENHLVKKS